MKYKYLRAWRERTKARIVEAMGGKCVCCEYHKCVKALALHHLDPEEKDFNFGAIRANAKSWAKIVVELRKCVLICHNCHAEVHDGIAEIPKDAPRFNEDFAEYKTKKVEKGGKCTKCTKPIPSYNKYCSQKCAAKARISVPWESVDLEKMYQEVTIVEIANRLGCSDAAVHKRLKKMGLK